MNWGTKIFIGLGVCMLCIVCTGIYMVVKNTDSLEEVDYYEKSLHYDEVYLGKQNLLRDDAGPAVRVIGDTLCIDFKEAHNQGYLKFKRPADDTMDTTLPFATTASGYRVAIASFQKGNWQMEISWESEGKTYISEHRLYF
ncbi:FixH family protein [Sphingobacterium deserti]|uniref:FixH family protein n=1 Tax=Sphingobacterium deserti TaxID=1229276 RepID=A0A0B8T3P3_9SPHI|nr:FixH family protein [Sphingobacterium deserti]KGE15806.1 FixH family protein [Sphingobacterium deserti]